MKILKLLGGLVLLLVIALVVVGCSIDSIAKAAIEQAGSEALGVPTTVESCDVGLLSASFGMQGLRVANPEGFGSEPFLSLGSGSVAVSAGSLRSEKVELPELTLDAVRLGIVQNAGGSNYGAILDNLERFQGSDTPKEGEGTRFVVRKLLISDVLVTVTPDSKLGIGAVKLPIDRIELKDIGSDTERGVLLSELAGIVVKSILQRATSSGKLPAVIQGALGGKLQNLQGAAYKELDNQLDKVKKGVGDKLKGLIGK